jgi:ubiquinone/menaquinone biosynthesis C-methylase UbiE
MSSTKRNDTWASGAAYEPYVGRWSRRIACEFLDWLAVPRESRWLDVGCGTGALSQTILTVASPVSVVAIDPSAGFITFAQAQVADNRLRFQVGDARALPFASKTFDAVVAGLVLNFVPEPALAVAEMARAARPGGTVAAYVWDYAGEMQMMRYFWDAAVALDPAARALNEGERFLLCKPELLEASFRALASAT